MIVVRPNLRVPEIIGFSGVGTASGTSVVVSRSSLPTLQTGDYLVAVLRSGQSSATVGWTSSGFTEIGTPVSINSGNRICATLAHTVNDPALEPTSYSFSYTGTGLRNAAVILVVRGVNMNSPVTGSLSANPTDGFSTTNGSLVLSFVGNEAVSGVTSAPSVLDADYVNITDQSSATGTTTTRTIIWIGSYVANSDFAPSASDTTWTQNAARTFWYVSLQGIF